MKIIRRRKTILLTGIISILFGIGTSLYYWRQTPLPITQPDLHQFQYISIEDGWSGPAIYSPIERKFLLRRVDHVFLGNGSIRVGGDFVHSSTSYLSIQVPNDDMERVMNLLTNSKITLSAYQPVLTHSDDHPHIKLGFTREGNKVEFYTSSQSPQKNPWAYKINNQTYITPPGDPYTAYLILKKYLRDDLQEELEDLKEQYKQN